MNKLTKLLIIFALVVVLTLPIPTFAAGHQDDKVIFGGTYTLKSGETLNGDIVVFGGNATIEVEAVVNGDVAIFGGNIQTDGTINGDLVALGGYAEIQSHAVIHGDLTLLGSNVERSEDAVVHGTVVTQTDLPIKISLPSVVQLSRGTFPGFTMWRNPIVSLSWFVFKLLIWAGLAMLVTLFFRPQEERIAQASSSQPLISGVVGLMTVFLLPIVVIALLITIVLSPIAIFVAFIAWVLGWISLGYEVGRRLTRNMERQMDPALVAGLGTFVVMGIFNGISKTIPCLGLIPKMLVGMWMLGAVVLTLFGTQRYPQLTRTAPESPAEEETNETDP